MGRSVEARSVSGSTIAMAGLSHRTAPIELRERVHVDADSVREVVPGLLEASSVEECVVLSTCNRTEFYIHSADPASAQAAAIEVIARRGGMDTQQVEPHVYRSRGYESVAHLFRVAAGLDSLVVGEAEILGQVGDAYELGLSLPNTVGPVLHRLFQSARAVGGVVRSETRLGHGAASIPSAAVQLAIKVFGSLEGKTAMVLGAGDMGVITLRCLLAEGVSQILVGNRTVERARETVAQIGGVAVSMEGFWDELSHVDILVTSTASTHPVVDRSSLSRARQDTGSPLLVLDIALPRDVEPEAGALPGVFLYNIDDLQKVVGEAEEARRAEVSPAERLVTDHATRFWRWYRSRAVAPVIRGLRAHGEAIRLEELERLFADLDAPSELDRERIEQATRRLLNKLLHPSTVAVRRAAIDPNAVEFLDSLRAELGLDGPPQVPEGERGGSHGLAASSRSAAGPEEARGERTNEARG